MCVYVKIVSRDLHTENGILAVLGGVFSLLTLSFFLYLFVRLFMYNQLIIELLCLFGAYFIHFSSNKGLYLTMSLFVT